ncbi:MAG: lysoplasmalogenase [Desulfobacterales bacterium]|nr:MAG: lysoplasmalogenase [Desulfobacterales bacterium]
MLDVLIIILALILLFGLLYFEKQRDRKAALPTKTLVSCLFIVIALVQPHPLPGYFYLLLIGLIFCLGGDVFLALPQEKMFLYGLVSFLLGHVFYVIAFFYAAQINQWTWIGSALCLVFSCGIYLWLRPHLGAMNLPVLFYVIVITIMVAGAWTVFGDGKLALNGRLLVFIGALSFYFSDVFVARDRFLKPEFMNRLLGLPLYYFGQFLLAFSVGVLN